ncbi:MAG: glycosyltransferase family 39 protein [Elusimicrobia bacterium]|nr:glycosyltransferase family 39 protein [Elusimicrobiota bacterium]
MSAAFFFKEARIFIGKFKAPQLLALFLLALMFVWSNSAIRRLSVTYDEPVHIAGGYVAWKWGDYHFQGLDHPPLAEMISSAWLSFKMRRQLPLANPQDSAYRNHWIYDVGDALLYHSALSHELILRACRWSLFLVFAPLLIVVLWLYAKKLSPGSEYWAVALLAVEPSLLAHGALATKDFASAVFILAAVFVWCLFLERPTELKAALLGIFVASAMLCKYTNLVIWPLLVFIGVFHWRQWTLTHAKRISVMVIPVFLIFLFCYQGLDWHVYGEGARSTWARAADGRWSFFWGEHSKRGWLLYFPMAFLMKTNLCHLTLAIAGYVLVAGRFRGRRFGEVPATVMALLLVPAGAMAMGMISTVQIGHRHILTCYPFLILMASVAANHWSRRAPWSWVVWGLMAWGVISTGRISPYFLSYFNELSGGASRGYQFFTDSNVDWGQGLGELGQYLKTHFVSAIATKTDKGAMGLAESSLPVIYLSYFGSGDPGAYGIGYVPIGFVSNVVRRRETAQSPALSPKIILAVSATNLQGTYYAKKDAFEFLKSRKPLAQIAYSILVYDLTGDRGAILDLAGLFDGAGNTAEANLLRRRAQN